MRELIIPDQRVAFRNETQNALEMKMRTLIIGATTLTASIVGVVASRSFYARRKKINIAAQDNGSQGDGGVDTQPKRPVEPTPTPPSKTPEEPVQESPKQEPVESPTESQEGPVEEQESKAPEVKQSKFRRVKDYRTSIVVLRGVTWTLKTHSRTTRREITNIGLKHEVPHAVVREWRKRCRGRANGEHLVVDYYTRAFCAHGKKVKIEPEVVIVEEEKRPFVQRPHVPDTIRGVVADSPESQSPSKTDSNKSKMEELPQKSPKSGGEAEAVRQRGAGNDTGGKGKSGTKKKNRKGKKGKPRIQGIPVYKNSDLQVLRAGFY